MKNVAAWILAIAFLAGCGLTAPRPAEAGLPPDVRTDLEALGYLH